MTSVILPKSILVLSTIFDPMKMKRVLYFAMAWIIFLATLPASAQIKGDSFNLKKQDSPKAFTRRAIDTATQTIVSDSAKKNRQKKATPARKNDSTLYSRPAERTLPARQQPGTTAANSPIDTIKITQDTTIEEPVLRIHQNIINQLLPRNQFINTKDTPVSFMEERRNAPGKEFLFYSLCIIVLILGIFKSFFAGYFNNLFRVFFNTSLRQTQLVDQLIQAKLPSFFLNIFFTITLGFYIWLLFTHFHQPRLINARLLLPFCILTIIVLYFIKFCLLKFIGWISDNHQATNSYIFVIFLVNKITGILLVPFIILLAFSRPEWTNSIATISVLVLGLFFLTRYVKSYGVIENKIPVNPFHFIIYVAGAEVLPLFIIYKIAVDYFI